MGAVYPAICGQVLCGQTRVGTWQATWDRPALVLKPRTFSITISEGPLVILTVNRPVLFLNARSFGKQTSVSLALGRPTLRLLAKPFIISPFLLLALNRPRLVLLARSFVLGLSSSPAFGRPVLYLLGGRLAHAGRPGLVPTVPESILLTPSPTESELLVPAEAETGLLVPTSTVVR